MNNTNEYLTIREFDKIVIIDVSEKLIENGQYDLLVDNLADVAEKNKNVGVNLKAVRHLNSRTIYALSVAVRIIHQHSNHLYVIGASENVEALFYVNNLDRLFFIVPDEKDLIG
jgi:hypothetical protein